MTLTLKEIMDSCYNWDRFCELHGFSVYAVEEGGGDVQVSLTIHQAHHLGIVRIRDSWKIKEFNQVYPNSEF